MDSVSEKMYLKGLLVNISEISYFFIYSAKSRITKRKEKTNFSFASCLIFIGNCYYFEKKRLFYYLIILHNKFTKRFECCTAFIKLHNILHLNSTFHLIHAESYLVRQFSILTNTLFSEKTKEN